MTKTEPFSLHLLCVTILLCLLNSCAELDRGDMGGQKEAENGLKRRREEGSLKNYTATLSEHLSGGFSSCLSSVSLGFNYCGATKHGEKPDTLPNRWGKHLGQSVERVLEKEKSKSSAHRRTNQLCSNLKAPPLFTLTNYSMTPRESHGSKNKKSQSEKS